ncbi:ABC transporter substrate-binding protein [Roseococcus sp.]|uniref:ABC transporter substrate-binding protein n=1 Tax=Roseococcus sp. TaxID=2109646 RepID=UPI003BAD10C1
MIRRREFLAAGGAATLAAPPVRAAPARVLRFVPQVDLAILDPTFASFYVTRNHGYMVFDTLYGLDGNFAPQPQMASGHVVGADGRQWDITLRDGLLWHDGEKVLARDCVASIRRWMLKDALGAAVMEATDELSAPDDRTIRFRLKKPFPLLAYAMGKTAAPMCAMMPERIASSDPNRPITEMVGSGPYRYLAGERLQGALNVYERFDRYAPRETGTPDWTAGPKVTHFDRVEWTTLPDASTASAALMTGEQDWWENASLDLLPALRARRGIRVAVTDRTGWIGVMRANHTQPPFNNPAIRRAFWGGLDQASVMQGIVGNEPSLYQDGVGVFCPNTPMASDAGLEVLKGPRDYEKVKREILAAGYKSERVVVLAPADFPSINTMALICADQMRKCGLNVEVQSIDWASMTPRRSNRESVDRGGWSVFFTAVVGSDLLNPGGHFILRAQGAGGWFGWPDSPRIETLRQAWFDAPDEAAQQSICRDLQRQAVQDAPYYPLGQYQQPTAYKSNLTGMLDGFATFWSIRRG